MTFRLLTHDGWGRVPVGEFPTLEAARNAFTALCQDPWYRNDGSVRGIELVESGPSGEARRIDWQAFS